MRLSTVILPIYRWSEGRSIWRRAEAMGFHAAYTYDHLSWRTFRDRTWFGAISTLAAAAVATDRLRLGTLVTSPNFRHPVTLAKELMTLDDVSDGRLTVGIGSGGVGFDATVLGQAPWSASERTERFEEFVPMLHRLLTQRSTTQPGAFYAAEEARMIPGCVQQPRVPFVIAATGPRGLALAAAYGRGWVTYGSPAGTDAVPADHVPVVISSQMDQLREACSRQGRAYDELDKLMLQGSSAERPLRSLDAFVDWAGRYQALGMTELVIHWPVPESIFDCELDLFETIATEGLAQLR